VRCGHFSASLARAASARCTRFLHPHRGPAKGALVDAIDAAAVAFYQKFLEPPKVPATPLDKET